MAEIARLPTTNNNDSNLSQLLAMANHVDEFNAKAYLSMESYFDQADVLAEIGRSGKKSTSPREVHVGHVVDEEGLTCIVSDSVTAPHILFIAEIISKTRKDQEEVVQIRISS